MSDEMSDEQKNTEQDDLKKIEQLIRGEDDVLFDNFINKKRFDSKFWLYVTLVICFIFFVGLYKFTVLDKIIPPEELKASMELFNIDSKWVETEKIKEKDFEGIIMAPQISFQIRNIGKTKLSYVYILSVFKVMNRAKALGDDSIMSLREELAPGEESERIVLTSAFGYRTTSKRAFDKNATEWKNAQAEIYVKSGSSVFTFLKKFYIIRRIDGYESEREVTLTSKLQLNK
ncbi:MAG: hypothetical protein GY757_33185 [bacterium]|nr:hypothetical protein [bacterium]